MDQMEGFMSLDGSWRAPHGRPHGSDIRTRAFKERDANDPCSIFIYRYICVCRGKGSPAHLIIHAFAHPFKIGPPITYSSSSTSLPSLMSHVHMSFTSIQMSDVYIIVTHWSF